MYVRDCNVLSLNNENYHVSLYFSHPLLLPLFYSTFLTTLCLGVSCSPFFIVFSHYIFVPCLPFSPCLCFPGLYMFLPSHIFLHSFFSFSLFCLTPTHGSLYPYSSSVLIILHHSVLQFTFFISPFLRWWQITRGHPHFEIQLFSLLPCPFLIT